MVEELGIPRNGALGMSSPNRRAGIRVLAVGAHPDDVEIFMFGMLAACKERGDEIGWIVATDGAGGGSGGSAELVAQRQAEAREAGALLGVEPMFMGAPDGSLVESKESRDALAGLVSGYRPDLVLTHPPCDYHPDHRALSRTVQAVTCFNAPLLYADSYAGVGFLPNVYVDIFAYAALKRQAILCHRSQEPQRFVELADVMGRFRGLQVNGNTTWAEAYRFDPVYPFGDVRDLLPSAPPVRSLDVKNCR